MFNEEHSRMCMGSLKPYQRSSVTEHGISYVSRDKGDGVAILVVGLRPTGETVAPFTGRSATGSLIFSGQPVGEMPRASLKLRGDHLFW